MQQRNQPTLIIKHAEPESSGAAASSKAAPSADPKNAEEKISGKGEQGQNKISGKDFRLA